jgi:hypothetical protein
MRSVLEHIYDHTKTKNKVIKMVVPLIYILFEEVLTAVNIKMKFLWDVVACSLVDEYESFR